MNDRIKLAEAMGWTDIKRHSDAEFRDLGYLGIPPGSMSKVPVGIPSPFTDANDDYAVLEWMRDGARRMGFPRYVGALSDVMDKRLATAHAANYQIGDYARAALKVIDD